MEKSRVKIKLKKLKMYEVQSSYIVFLHAHRTGEDGGRKKKVKSLVQKKQPATQQTSFIQAKTSS